MKAPLLTPGTKFLLRNTPYLLTPPSIIFAALNHYDSSSLALAAKIAISVVAGALSLPILLWVSSTYTRYKERVRAANHGAVLPPVINEGWGILGEFKAMQSLVENQKAGDPSKFVNDWPERYGNTFIVRPPFSGFIFTTEPDFVKAVLATEFDTFEKGPLFISAMDSVLGTGVFNSDGDMWKFHRALTRPFFSKSRISDFDTFDRNGLHAVEIMRSHSRAGKPVDFQEVINRFTLDSAASFLFGLDLDSLASLDENATKKTPLDSGVTADEFSRAFAEAQELISSRNLRGPVWALSELKGDITQPAMETVNKFLDPIVKKALAALKEKPAGESTGISEVNEGDTLLDHLVKNTNDPVVIKDEILNILIAGKDTIASTLSSLIYKLASNKDVLTRLREEILQVVGPTSAPTNEDIKEMKYLRAVINETLRLYPAVPFDNRTAKRDVVLKFKSPSGEPFFVPQDMGVFLMHRRTDLWGPDALEFDPDRFIDERLQKYLVKNPFIFLPFNAGPRICLGQQFAYNEMSFILVRMLQAFSDINMASPLEIPTRKGITSAENKQEVNFMFHLTMFIEGGLWVHMKEADSAKIEAL